MIALLFDHLWQSTLFALAVGLLTLLFRDNGAHVRFWLWFAASLKFLMPFSIVATIGGHLLPPAPFSPGLAVILPAAQPFSTVTPVMTSSPAASGNAPLILLVLWALGCAAVLSLWALRWGRLRSALRRATPLALPAPIPAKSSCSILEPGLVGIWRPVLLLPDGIAEKLRPAELQSIFAHELCHMRRRDNLTGALHMVVQAMFWFWPPVWWLGARLAAERERACDEAVLAEGNDPRTYAESILKVCKFHLCSSLGCVSGISGADLKERMERIMKNSAAIRLSAAKKLLLGTAAALAMASPIALTLVQAASAQASDSEPTAALKAEQARPRRVIAFDPRAFDKFVGYYQMSSSGVIFHITRRGSHYFEGVIGQTPVEMYPDSESEFFLKGLSLPAQFSFAADADGRVTQMILHQGGAEQHATRVEDATGRRAEAALAKRIADNVQSPGTKQALRRLIEGLMRGRPDYDEMVGNLAVGTRQMLPALHKRFSGLGKLTSIDFTGIGKNGMDLYEVAFEREHLKAEIAPLTPSGEVTGLFFFFSGKKA